MSCNVPYPPVAPSIERPILKTKDSSVALLVAIAYFGAGADTVAFSLPFGQLKLAAGIFICMYFLLGKYIYYTKTELLCAAGVIGACLVSTFFSINVPRSIAYTLLLAFNIFCVASIGRALFSLSPKGFKAGLILCARLQILMGVCLAVLGLQDRVSIFFYEPSYWAIALTPYLYFTAKKHISLSWPDWVLIFTALLLTKSANLVLLVVIAIVVSHLSSFSLKSILRMAVFLAITLGFLCFYAHVSDDLIAITVRRILESDSILQQCLERGGTRYPRMMVALDVFKNNLIHGIGPGTFFSFDKTEAILNSYPAFFPRHNIEQSPAINIFVEMGAEGGIIFLSAFVYYLYRGLMSKNSDTTYRYVMLVMILGLLFEASIQRTYFWVLLGAASFMSSGAQAANHSLQLNGEGISLKELYLKLRAFFPRAKSA